MRTNILLVHGNGGANARFQLFLEEHRKKGDETVYQVFLPELPGFEGRELPIQEDLWSPFIAALGTIVEKNLNNPWVVYGHGIGGSFLLEWAARNWLLPNGKTFNPKLVILHSIIGASLAHRWFPKVMKWRVIRWGVQQMIPHPWLRKSWERKLFLTPEAIPQDLKDQFFQDYKRCLAFPVLFDMITPKWYSSLSDRLSESSYFFLWGGKERVIASNFLRYWKEDFPKASFEVVTEWDHFPMLEQPQEFYHKLMEIIKNDEQT